MASNTCRMARASPSAFRIAAWADPSARRIAPCLSPSAVRICDCLTPSAVRIAARRSRSARICCSIEPWMDCGGSIDFSSTRLTRTPQRPVASSRTPRSWPLIWSRLVSVGSMDLEQTLTSRDQINGQLRGVLDEATGRWGVRVNRVELKSIDPPQSIQGSMEQQMRAERDRRAAILTAEGVKQSQILTAEGDKQGAILRAEGNAQAAILNAEGQARAILQVFDAVHRGDADPKLLAYQYLQILPKLAASPANKVWIIPSEFTTALKAIASGFGGASDGGDDGGIAWRAPGQSPLGDGLPPTALTDPAEALAEARRQSEAATRDATSAGTLSGRPFERSAEAGQHAGGPQRATPPVAPVPPAPPADEQGPPPPPAP